MISALIFILIVVLFVVILIIVANLQGRITRLQLQIQSLQKRVDHIQSSTHEVNHASLSDATTSQDQQQSPIEDEQEAIYPSDSAHTKESVTTVNQITHNQTTVKPISRFKPISQEERDKNRQKIDKLTDKNHFSSRFIQWLIKGNPVAKIAIIILFFGLSYLLKYSIDHQLLSPEVRILGSLLLGFVLLALGWKLRKKREPYALTLQGAAIGILYLTLFAAFKLYALVPLLLTFSLLIIISAASVVFAILQRAISLAILAYVGGYLAPILLSTNTGNHIALFSYYLLISVTILVISFWQSWRMLNLVGFLFTFIVAVLWGRENFHPNFYPECQIFILANMLIYGILSVLLSIRNTKKEPYQNLFDLILLFSVPLAAFSLQYAITERWEFVPAFSSLGFGLFYLIGSFVILRIWQDKAKQLALYGLAIGLGFSTLAVPLALTANWTALIWLFEGTAITCIALSQKQYRFAWIGSLIVLFGAFLLIARTIQFAHMDNTTFITLYGVMSGLLLFNACLWHHYRALHATAHPLKLLFFIISILAWSIWIIDSTNRLFDYSVDILQPIIACYIIAVWVWFAIGRRINWFILRYAVIALWPVLLLALFYNILLYVHSYSAGIPGLIWFVAFASGYCYLYIDRNHLTQYKWLAPVLHISLLWIILGWSFFEIDWLLSFLPWGFAVVQWSTLTVMASLIILGFFFLQKYRCFPILQYPSLYWRIGLLPIVLYLLFNFIGGIYSSGQIIYWTYVPFINPLEESAALALMMLMVWFSQVIKLTPWNKPAIISRNQLSIFAMLLIIFMIFCWSNSIILRALSQWLSISWSFYALWHNNIVQIVLSLVWTLTAVILVMIANRYVMRRVWFAGAVLQGMVVIKLVLVDSVELDGLMRAFVFIGVALLMLVIGYLAPLPPKSVQPHKATSENENKLNKATGV